MSTHHHSIGARVFFSVVLHHPPAAGGCSVNYKLLRTQRLIYIYYHHGPYSCICTDKESHDHREVESLLQQCDLRFYLYFCSIAAATAAAAAATAAADYGDQNYW